LSFFNNTFWPRHDNLFINITFEDEVFESFGYRYIPIPMITYIHRYRYVCTYICSCGFHNIFIQRFLTHSQKRLDAFECFGGFACQGGQCYDHNFRRFLLIFGEKIAISLKTNVMFNIWHNIALFWVKASNVFCNIFGENIFKNPPKQGQQI
jgi:hypothetical protein